MYFNALALASIISVVFFDISCSKTSLAAAQIVSTDQEFLTVHNSARAVDGVGPLSWSAVLADYARDYSNKCISGCQLVGSDGFYGENVFWGSGREYTPTDAVDAWVSEKQYYDYDTNTCATGKVCRHYTQVVWEATVRIGCARTHCDNGTVLMICNYSPTGNEAGLRPYQVPGVVFTNWGRIVARVVSEPDSSTRDLKSQQDFVNSHNSARATVGVGPVSWNETVAAYAQDYAHQRIGDCRLVQSGGPYGENLFSGFGADYTATDAVNAWVSEQQYYDYNSNSCVDRQECGHYTQVVWRSSTAIGCARMICNNGWIFIICSYNPPGNFVRQRPY